MFSKYLNRRSYIIFSKIFLHIGGNYLGSQYLMNCLLLFSWIGTIFAFFHLLGRHSLPKLCSKSRHKGFDIEETHVNEGLCIKYEKVGAEGFLHGQWKILGIYWWTRNIFEIFWWSAKYIFKFSILILIFQ